MIEGQSGGYLVCTEEPPTELFDEQAQTTCNEVLGSRDLRSSRLEQIYIPPKSLRVLALSLLSWKKL